MPVIKAYRHGMTAGVAPMNNSHLRAPRGIVEGWSSGATRRNTGFLRSIREDQLTGFGVAVTLTLKTCPAPAVEWHRMRRAWEMRMVRAGMIRLHWVTEWQRRGVPHLHAAIWFETSDTRTPLDAWVDVATAHGAGLRGQNAKPITGAVGWFKYLSKHASRGVQHYQRNPENIPPGWQKRTGRVWGKSGHWPVRPVVRFNLQDQNGDGGWFAFRRMVRSWRFADARASGDLHRIRQARSMLWANEKAVGRVKGISEWVREDDTMKFLGNLAERGYSVTC